jgi:gliding motility-associated protein GldL
MKTEKAFNFIYSIGAAVVIYGALLKITHRSNADLFLTIGLVTEVIIFTLTAFQELFKRNNSIEIASYPKIEGVDNSALTESVNNLNQTIKQVFNR